MIPEPKEKETEQERIDREALEELKEILETGKEETSTTPGFDW